MLFYWEKSTLIKKTKFLYDKWNGTFWNHITDETPPLKSIGKTSKHRYCKRRKGFLRKEAKEMVINLAWGLEILADSLRRRVPSYLFFVLCTAAHEDQEIRQHAKLYNVNHCEGHTVSKVMKLVQFAAFLFFPLLTATPLIFGLSLLPLSWGVMSLTATDMGRCGSVISSILLRISRSFVASVESAVSFNCCSKATSAERSFCHPA